MRGVAALLVVIVHTVDQLFKAAPTIGRSHIAHLGHIDNFGSAGVDLFFIISGFVMALSVQKAAGARDAGDFLSLRWVRIAPPFLIACVASVAFYVVTNDMKPWQSYANAILFVPIFDGRSYTAPPLAVGWTLSFEFTFYLAVAVMVILRLAKRLEFLALFMGAVVLVGQLTHPEALILNWLTNPILLEFALGIIAYRSWQKGWLNLATWLRATVGGLGVLALLCEVVFGYGQISEAQFVLDSSLSLQRVLLWGLPMLLIFVAFLPEPKASERRRIRAAAQGLGDISYSLYLTNFLTLTAFGAVLSHSPHLPLADVAFFVAIAVSIVGGLIYYRLVERPLTSALRGRLERRHARRGLPPVLDERGALEGSAG